MTMKRNVIGMRPLRLSCSSEQSSNQVGGSSHLSSSASMVNSSDLEQQNDQFSCSNGSDVADESCTNVINKGKEKNGSVIAKADDQHTNITKTLEMAHENDQDRQEYFYTLQGHGRD